ncbi:hypothetical protein TRVA0_062S00276 [Trichomonascus vanleenenianus]|uniref:uncharacterized protein n=1 Tax=Trichomonascus vanleenenianus TaxID=2268995 RepID=UPI003ECAB0F8
MAKRERKPVPPLPDLRFEHAYRKAIAKANGSPFWIVVLTIRDQMFMPLVQGFLWNFFLVGLKTWRLSASASGSIWGYQFRNWIDSLKRRPVEH